MADSLRKRILQNLDDALGAVGLFRVTGLGHLQLKDAELPSASIIPLEENSALMDMGDPGTHENQLTVAVRCIVDDGDILRAQKAGYYLEDALAAAQQAVLADRSRGGLAQTTRLTGVKYLYVDQAHPEAGADLLLTIEYVSGEKDPSV